MSDVTDFIHSLDVTSTAHNALLAAYRPASMEAFREAFASGEMASLKGVGPATLAAVAQGLEALEAPTVPQEAPGESRALPPAPEEITAEQPSTAPVALEYPTEYRTDLKRGQALADSQQASMDQAMASGMDCCRVRLKPNSGFLAPALTIIFAGRGHTLGVHVDLIVRGQPMMQAVMEACQRFGITRDHLEISPVSGKEPIRQEMRVISTITLKSSTIPSRG